MAQISQNFTPSKSICPQSRFFHNLTSFPFIISFTSISPPSIPFLIPACAYFFWRQGGVPFHRGQPSIAIVAGWVGHLHAAFCRHCLHSPYLPTNPCLNRWPPFFLILPLMAFFSRLIKQNHRRCRLISPLVPIFAGSFLFELFFSNQKWIVLSATTAQIYRGKAEDWENPFYSSRKN